MEIVKKIVKSNDRALAFEFFLFFSRFEYALKRTGFVNSKAEADWDTFAKKNKGLLISLDQNIPFRSAIDYLKDNLPKKQVICCNRLCWEDDSFSGTFDLDRVFVLVRRIRNNLFHGGKFPEGPEYDISRDRILLESSLVILQTCLERDGEVLEDIDK